MGDAEPARGQVPALDPDGPAATAALPSRIADVIAVPVTRGGRVLVFSDLRMVPGGNDVSREASRAIAGAIEECRGPAVVVFAGDMFDLLRDGRPDLEGALAAHPRLGAALASFLGAPERRIVFLPGTRDAALANDMRLAGTMQANGWETALSYVLEIDTGEGVRVVRVEPGHGLDPSAAFTDPRDPHDHPLAQHLEREVLPMLATSCDSSHAATWLQGIEDADPADMGSLVASRFAYRRLFRRAVWLTLPLFALLALFFPVAVWSARHHNAVTHVFRLLAGGFVIEVALVVIALAFVIAQLRDALSSVSWWAREARSNDEARGAAVALAAAGDSGLVTAHTRRPELTDLGGGAFYANCGGAGRVVERLRTRAGMPPVYGARLRCSWLELEAGADLHVRLSHGTREQKACFHMSDVSDLIDHSAEVNRGSASTMLALSLFMVATLASCSRMQPKPTLDANAYAKEIDAWHQERWASLKSEDGWLTLVGLFWLKEGENKLGSDR